jgi:N utilization substance protein B
MCCAQSNGSPPGRARNASAARSARHRARELALQALYGWLLAGGEHGPIAARMKGWPGYGQADEAYFLELVGGTIGSAEALRAQWPGVIDRPPADLSPIEHSILLIATYELAHRPEVPYKVVINEAIELAKDFGGTDGFRYVNGVLNKLAGRMRAGEASGTRAADEEPG